MATHSSILAWKILWTEEPGGLQSMGSQRVRHDRERACTHAHTHTHRLCRRENTALFKHSRDGLNYPGVSNSKVLTYIQQRQFMTPAHIF